MNNPLANLNNIQKIIAVVIGVVIVGVGVFFGFRAIFSRASGNEPQNVSITDITQNSAKVNWVSATEVQCSVRYSTSASDIDSDKALIAPETRESINHAVDLTFLAPGTAYNFKIKCADKSFDNGGVPWTFTTKESVKQVTPSATPVPVQPTAAPSIAPSATPAASSCLDTDCTQVKAKIGKGCSTYDYIKCINKPKTTP